MNIVPARDVDNIQPDGTGTQPNVLEDGYNWDYYQDDDHITDIGVPAAGHGNQLVSDLTDLSPKHEAVFRNARKASVPSTDGQTSICYNKCDVDSISITSTSLLKVVFRMCKRNCGFSIKTKIDVQNVDKSSRNVVKCLHGGDVGVENFGPTNRSGTARQEEISLSRFKNILLGEFRVTGGSMYLRNVLNLNSVHIFIDLSSISILLFFLE
jgi:hypothetical protein